MTTKSYWIPCALSLREHEESARDAWGGDCDGEFQNTVEFDHLFDPVLTKKLVCAAFDLDDRDAPHRFTTFAAYNHAFARNMAAATTNDGKLAFDVITSDASEYWAQQGRELGFECTRASVENAPTRNGTVAHIGYEPYPILGRFLDIMGIMHALANAQGYGEFFTNPFNSVSLAAHRFHTAKKFYDAEPHHVKFDVDGASIEGFALRRNTPSRRASLDMKTVNAIADLDNGYGVRLPWLCERIEATRDDAIASVERLAALTQDYYEAPRTDHPGGFSQNICLIL
ncbi:MAG: hypothetical protein OXR66_08795 [Candidatus Woesearchaeota archaeon]|nr:hypothetical protein [Candidatus Woesearchaeota archaeon]